MNPDEVMQFAQDNGVKFVDVKFTDLPGTWQHFTRPDHRVRGRYVRGRFGIRRLQYSRFPGDQRERHAVVPDAATVSIDPFTPSLRSP